MRRRLGVFYYDRNGNYGNKKDDKQTRKEEQDRT
jgi:hypothetical protein